MNYKQGSHRATICTYLGDEDHKYTYICARGIHFVSVSTKFRLEFKTVPRVWHFLFFIFISKTWSITIYWLSHILEIWSITIYWLSHILEIWSIKIYWLSHILEIWSIKIYWLSHILEIWSTSIYWLSHILEI